MQELEVEPIPPQVFKSLPKEVQTYIEALQTQISELKALLSQNSQNSNKPPSSDPPYQRPPKKAKAGAKPKGGQVGHVKHQRALVALEQVDEVVELRPTHCCNPLCLAPLKATDQIGPPQRHQVWELPVVKASVTEYQLYGYECRLCHNTTTAPWPSELPPGQFGPQLLATLATLHGQYQLSLRQVQAVAFDLWQLPLSLGAISDACAKTSQALAPAYQQIEQYVQQSAPAVHLDETGWYHTGQLCWLWVAVAPRASLFALKRGRGRAELQGLIGSNYNGFVHSDRLRTYLSLEATRHQLCWAHLLRNLEGLAQRASPAKEWGESMLNYAHQLFSVWHSFEDSQGHLSRAWLQAQVEPVRAEFLAGLERGLLLADGKVKAFCKELIGLEERLYLFVKEEGLTPTNNAAERALRPGVIWRKKCYGNQSQWGQAFVERVLSLAATCQQHGLNFLTFATHSLQALWQGLPPPTLNFAPSL